MAVTFLLLVAEGGEIEQVAMLLEPGGHVEDVGLGVGGVFRAAFGISFVGEPAEVLALPILGFAERVGAEEVFRRLAVAEGEGAVLGAEEAGVLGDEAAGAGLDPHVRR